MELFRNLRIKVGKSLLAARVARITRKPYYLNFSNIKNIGLVWDASKTQDFRSMSVFHQRMSERNIDVKILGYFPGKELPDQYTAIRYFTCLKKRETDFFYRPTSAEANSFASHKFDVLIDINFKKLFPLQYISWLSQAGLKVGLADANPELSPFDLTISMKDSVNIDAYLDQVLYYLNMIDSEKVKKVV